MDSNFEGTNMEQWQEIENSPFEEMDELPVPESEDVGESSTDAAGAKKTEEEREEERKREEHEVSEAKRKAEWEAKQQEKKEAELREIYRLDCMADEDVVVASMQRISKDTEKLTRRNMKDCVSEHVQTLCLEDADFARLTMHPRKCMINCFHYINRKAREFVEQEMKDNDIKPENGVYGSDVPDDLCYQWAEDYFRDPDAPEDNPEKEEKFVPIPYRGKSVAKTNKKKADKKSTGNKAAEKKEAVKAEDKISEKKVDTEEEKGSLTGQMSLMDYLMPSQSMAQKAS